METGPPVILIGRGVTALGALRCLTRHGITVYSVCDDPLVPRSRYYRPAVDRQGRVWRCELGTEGYARLADLPLDRAVLIPCADDMAMWVAELPAELQQRFLASNPRSDSLVQLQDKRCFARLCERLNVPHPRSFLVSHAADLDAVPFEDMPRAFFKPSNSIPFLKAFGVKGKWVHDRHEARRIYADVCQSNQDVFVQEYVNGGADEHYFIDGFVDRTGVVRATFARRRSRIFPLDFGNSSYCFNIPLESIQPAWDSLQKILREVSYHGIFSAEFKRDTVDGRYKILEVNTRVWVYVEFAAWCGVDMCHLAYLDACQQPVPEPKITRPGRECVDLYHDYCSVRAMAPADRPSWLTLMGQWARSRKTVFQWNDLKPALGWAAGALRARLTRSWVDRSVMHKSHR